MQKITPRLFSLNFRTQTIILFGCTLLITGVWLRRYMNYEAWNIATLPFRWNSHASDFVLSERHDHFDVTFSNYTRRETSAAPYQDVVPPILHHIVLGKRSHEFKDEWLEARQSCIDWHPDWETYLWTDETAEEFVGKKFPGVLATWKGYKYPVQRVDALRYMVLYEYGGAVLDMDLRCNRALGPLRRFEFVAPQAHPTGLSIGFMMASKNNRFVHSLIQHLAKYDKQWLGLPYSTVMFSAGCHYASVVHVEQPDRSSLKILPGPLHSLNGRVTTPIFTHLGSSSWHSYDAKCIVMLGKSILFVFAFIGGVALAVYVKRRRSLTRRSNSKIYLM